MAWEDFRASLRRLVQSKKTPQSTAGAIGSMARLSVLAGIAVAAILIPASTFVAVTGSHVTNDLVSLPLTLEDRPNPQTTRLLASNGELLAYFYQENRQEVPLDKIAPVMQKAILSIEDARFFDHGALDLKGTLRALVNNASAGQTQGGSTITQQLVKLTLLSQATSKKERIAATETSLARKARELKLAIAYEKEHTKKEILERYLNIAYFGDGATASRPRPSTTSPRVPTSSRRPRPRHSPASSRTRSSSTPASIPSAPCSDATPCWP